MDSNTLGKSSFFSKPSLMQTNTVQAAQIIQHWWQQMHLKHTAKESYQYITQVASLEQIQNKSFAKLEEFVLNKNTQEITHKLLMHLDQAKDLILPLRIRHPNFHQPERIFLSAYLIAVKSGHLFESPTDIDALLLTQACEMLKSFERLCGFMSKIYMEKIPHQADSGTAKDPSSSDLVFATMEHYQLSHSPERMKNDHHFITEGKVYLEAFHQAQTAYYETFTQWESSNRTRLAKTCINQYLQIEAKRLAIFTNADPRQIEIYERFGSQQETLRSKVKSLLGEEGLTKLDRELQESRTALEATKWVTAPTEVLLHELALNPEFKLQQEACMIHPKKDFDTAIAALAKSPIEIDPILELLEEIRDQIAFFTRHNDARIRNLHEKLNRKKLATTINDMGLETGLYTLICMLIENIKELESLGHVPETVTFQQEIEQRLSSGEQTGIVLKDALSFIYQKLSQINLEISNFNINQARPMLARNIVEFEQKKFQERLEGNQFNLAIVLAQIDAMIKSPTLYRLETSILCSQYVASYLSPALCLEIIQRPGRLDLHAIAETFYLEQEHLRNWHTKYQRIFYTATAMGYLDVFSQKYDARLSPDELLEQKKILMTRLEIEDLSEPKEVAGQILYTLKSLLTQKGKHLSALDEKALTKIIEEICASNHLMAVIMKKRLGDQLSYYLFKGYLPQSAQIQARLYGVETELIQLGKEMRSLIRHHVKVHGAFYKHSVEERLWKSLFIALRDYKEPKELSSLLSPEQDLICSTHASIHKMAFLFTGLSLIQQTIVHQDMWHLNTRLKYSTIKALAYSFGLVDMVNDARVSKDTIEKRLMELMKQVAKDQQIVFDAIEEQKMRKMLRLAKNGKSPGCTTFLEELSGIYRQFIKPARKPKSDSNLLIAAFTEEVATLREQVQKIITQIKQTQNPDDADPIVQTFPTLRAGRGYFQVGTAPP